MIKVASRTDLILHCSPGDSAISYLARLALFHSSHHCCGDTLQLVSSQTSIVRLGESMIEEEVPKTRSEALDSWENWLLVGRRLLGYIIMHTIDFGWAMPCLLERRGCAAMELFSNRIRS